MGPSPGSEVTGVVSQGLAGSQPERQQVWRRTLDEALPAKQLAEIRFYLQQRRALGRGAFKAMVKAKARRFASTRPAHRPHRMAKEASD